MTEDSALTATDVLARASEVLTAGDYRVIDDKYVEGWPSDFTRLFEDPYGIVAVVVFETWADLARQWLESQAALVELMSEYVGLSDAKAWDGYLVLLTPSTLPSAARDDAEAIRYNVSRVRKLVAAAPELQTLGDVERALLPLLPLEGESPAPDDLSSMELLSQVLLESRFDERAVSTLVTAFQEQQPLMERLHEYRREQ